MHRFPLIATILGRTRVCGTDVVDGSVASALPPFLLYTIIISLGDWKGVDGLSQRVERCTDHFVTEGKTFYWPQLHQLYCHIPSRKSCSAARDISLPFRPYDTFPPLAMRETSPTLKSFSVCHKKNAANYRHLAEKRLFFCFYLVDALPQ